VRDLSWQHQQLLIATTEGLFVGANLICKDCFFAAPVAGYAVSVTGVLYEFDEADWTLLSRLSLPSKKKEAFFSRPVMTRRGRLVVASVNTIYIVQDGVVVNEEQFAQVRFYHAPLLLSNDTVWIAASSGIVTVDQTTLSFRSFPFDFRVSTNLCLTDTAVFVGTECGKIVQFTAALETFAVVVENLRAVFSTPLTVGKTQLAFGARNNTITKITI
jgi:hypothetical protein